MGRRFLHVSDAGDDEKGSFCDTDSKNHYDNVNGATKEDRINDADKNGSEVVENDEPIMGDRKEPHSVDQRFNLFDSEEDNQGFFYSPAKHGPGR